MSKSREKKHYLLYFTLVLLIATLSLQFSFIHNSRSKFKRIPSDLINEATAYRIDPEESFPYVHDGKLPNGITDSVALTPEMWKGIVDISSEKFLDQESFLLCFYPTFLVVFKGGYHQYVGHITVSIECGEIRFTDNYGYHFLTKKQTDFLLKWYRSVFSKEFEPLYKQKFSF